MAVVSYRRACRSCLNAQDMGYSNLTYIESDIKNPNGRIKSEYELTKIWEQWFIDKEEISEFCSNINWQMWNVKVNNENLYNPKFLSMHDSNVYFMISIAEQNDDNILTNFSGSEYYPVGYFIKVFELIENEILSLRANNFIKFKDKGLIEITVSAILLNDLTYEYRIEKFFYTGFTHEECIKYLKFSKEGLFKGKENNRAFKDS